MEPEAAPKSTPPTQPISCTNCRSRKIKCDRISPCPQCLKSGLKCVFPARKRTQAPRKTKNTELLQRISRLESIVEKVDPKHLEAIEAAQAGHPVIPSLPQPEPDRYFPEPQHPPAEGQERSPGCAAAKDGTAMRYLSSGFWIGLCDEVEGLKQALEHSSDSEDEAEDDFSEETSPGSKTSQHTPLSTHLLPTEMLSDGGIHFPIPSDMRYLNEKFFDNVDPLCKVLHRPTIKASLDEFADTADRSRFSPARIALFCVIFFDAVTSMSPTTCLSMLGQDRSTLVSTYQASVDRALAAADYLNSTDLECLQALTLYIACLRINTPSRMSWTLLALPVRIAQALHLNRDIDVSTEFSPYETQLRRRLWWQLIVLDIRAAEDRGTEALIPNDSYSTPLPLNLNDEDFGPDSVGPLQEREGPTDMTFCLCTANCSGIFLYSGHPQTRVNRPQACMQAEEEIIKHAQHLEAKFVANADPKHHLSALASSLVRLVILKLWLTMQYPLHQGQLARPRFRVSHEAILQTAVAMIELEQRNFTGPVAERFAWWATAYPQWHPLAVTLAELCTQTRGDLVERAWRDVEVVLPQWGEYIADTKQGSLWRPIRKLYRKAKAARAAAISHDTPSTMDSAPGPATAPSTAVSAEQAPTPATVSKQVRAEALTGDPAALPMENLNMDPAAWLPSSQVMDWPDVNFDLPPNPDLDTMNIDWGTWGEFLNDTYGTGGPGTGSSSDGM